MDRSQARRTTGIVADSVLVAMLVGLLAFPLLPGAAAPDPIPPRTRASSRWPSSWPSASCSRPRRPGRYAREVDPMTRVRAALAFGSEYRPSGEALAGPVLVRPAVASADGWGRLPAADASVPPLRDQVDAVRMVVEQLGPSVPVIQTVFSPLTVAGYLVGEDRARAVGELRERPHMVGAALERIAAAVADFAARSVEAGAAGVFFAISGYASADAMSLGEYERLALHHDVRVMGAVPEAAWCNFLHLCGPRVHLDLAPSFERAHAVSWSVHEDGNPALAEGRELAGRAVMGGLDHRGTLVRGRPDDVLREVRSALAITGGKGLLLAPGCSVPPEAPEENLRAISQGPLGSGGR